MTENNNITPIQLGNIPKSIWQQKSFCLFRNVLVNGELVRKAFNANGKMLPDDPRDVDPDDLSTLKEIEAAMCRLHLV